MEERLKKFARLIDAGSFTTAANEMHTSQPAVTTAVQKLARELKAELLVHGSRTVRMTGAGEIAYSYGKKLLLAETNLHTEITQLVSGKQALSLGCIDSVADAIVKKELLAIVEKDSNVSLTVHNSDDLLIGLKKSRLDLILVASGSDPVSGISDQALGNERFALVCHPVDLHFNQKCIKQGKLPDFLAYNQTSHTFRLLQAQLQANGLEVAPRFYSTSPSILLELALQGRGIAALPQTEVAPYGPDKLIEIKLENQLYRPIVSRWQTGRRLPKSASQFLEAVALQLS
jgi:DNA-binding transcriptional LysR family regulator